MLVQEFLQFAGRLLLQSRVEVILGHGQHPAGGAFRIAGRETEFRRAGSDRLGCLGCGRRVRLARFDRDRLLGRQRAGDHGQSGIEGLSRRPGEDLLNRLLAGDHSQYRHLHGDDNLALVLRHTFGYSP